MRSRSLLVLVALTLATASCGRIRSCASRVIHGSRDDDKSDAPPVMSGPQPATPIKPHPRIWLDAATREVLAQRVAAGTPTWKRLDEKCAARMEGPVEWPDGKDYPSPGIGEGYQGEEYWRAVLDLALCSVTLRAKDPARSKAIAQRAADVLDKMSDIEGPHAVEPLRDDGFGIRFFVTALAIGYDWLHADLSPELKARMRAAMARWIETYDKKGFARDHPQGNYFAGYYSAKALAALATQDDDPKAATWWADWHDRMHKKMVQPYYAKNLIGGGWPEGWNYGALATLNMTWPGWAAYTAKDINVFRDPNAPFTFPFDQALQIVHFAWPDRLHIDDRGTNYEGDYDEVATLPTWTLTVLPAFLRTFNDPFAKEIQRLAREARAKKTDAKAPAWLDFLYWDASAPEADYTKLGLSFPAWGMRTVAMRSSWAEDAVWASFTSGPHVANAEAGHMQFDQGGLAIVHGGRGVLVNAATAVRRKDVGDAAAEHSGDNDPVYEELFGDHDKNPKKGNRSIFNVFYAHPKTGERFGQVASMPPKPKTKLARYEDKGRYVLVRGENIEDMYRKGKKNEVRVASWTRQVLYVRPSVFVIDDRTEIGEGDLDQYLAFHFPPTLAARAGATGTFDIAPKTPKDGPAAFVVVKPEGAVTKTSDLYDRKRVTRLEVRPASKDTKQRWLSVVDAAPAGAGVVNVKPIAGVFGTTIETSGAGNVVVVSAEGPTTRYSAPATATHFVTDLVGKQDFSVAVAREGDRVSITIERGAGIKSSDAGVLAFVVEPDGRVSPAAAAK